METDTHTDRQSDRQTDTETDTEADISLDLTDFTAGLSSHANVLRASRSDPVPVTVVKAVGDSAAALTITVPPPDCRK